MVQHGAAREGEQLACCQTSSWIAAAEEEEEGRMQGWRQAWGVGMLLEQQAWVRSWTLA